MLLCSAGEPFVKPCGTGHSELTSSAAVYCSACFPCQPELLSHLLPGYHYKDSAGYSHPTFSSVRRAAEGWFSTVKGPPSNGGLNPTQISVLNKQSSCEHTQALLPRNSS